MTDKLIVPTVNFNETADNLIIEKSQHIPEWWVDQLKADRIESSQRPAGEMHRAASIPAIVVEKWLAEGFDVFKEPVSKSIAKLKAEGLDYFITSDKV